MKYNVKQTGGLILKEALDIRNIKNGCYFLSFVAL